MGRLLKSFAAEESGNVVIDWVVLLSGSILLALSVVATVSANLDDITSGTSLQIRSVEVGSSG